MQKNNEQDDEIADRPADDGEPDECQRGGADFDARREFRPREMAETGERGARGVDDVAKGS
jgi:hypothetical protein